MELLLLQEEPEEERKEGPEVFQMMSGFQSLHISTLDKGGISDLSSSLVHLGKGNGALQVVCRVLTSVKNHFFYIYVFFLLFF